MTSSSSSSLNMSSEANLDDKVDFLMTKVSSMLSEDKNDKIGVNLQVLSCSVLNFVLGYDRSI